MKTKKLVSTISMLLSGFTLNAYAINNAPADADSVTLRTSCSENNGTTKIPNCFTSMDEVDNWLVNVRQSSATKPTIVNIGPGTFGGWQCKSSHVTLRGSGRDQTTFVVGPNSAAAAMWIEGGCTNLNVQDMKLDGRGGVWGVGVSNLEAITSWTNVEVIGPTYGWVESIPVPASCPNKNGKHSWFSSRIIATGNGGLLSGASRAYTASCAQSWFWGSELTTIVNANEANAFAIEAHNAEIHLYGSNARLLLATNSTVSSFGATGGGHYLMSALEGSSIHIHGTGLDVVHPGTGTADMLYADSTSHFHANESAFNIHVSGAGKVRRIGGAGSIEAPYNWKQGTTPPLSTKLDGTPTLNGTSTLISVSGADSYIETDCPVSGNCSLGGTFPHQMIYRAECTNTTANEGPWFDLTTKDCRK